MATVAAPQQALDQGTTVLDEKATASGPTKTPIVDPVPEYKPSPPPTLTSDQKAKYDEVLAMAQGWDEVATTSAKNSPKAALTDDERMWLTRECILRYLRASKWDVNTARDRLISSLVWRREYGIDRLTIEHLGPEQETGKQVLLGFDNDGRPCIYMDPSKQNTKESDRQIEHLVFWLERCIDVMPPGQETLAFLVDFKNTRASKNPSIGLARKVLSILQNHYPERLGKALISDLPWYVTTFFKLVMPFIDPVTKEKIVFSKPLNECVPAAQLQKNYGGDLDFVYDHDVYWPAIDIACKNKRDQMKERWEKRGKKVGDDEWILRGGKDSNATGLEEAVKDLTVES